MHILSNVRSNVRSTMRTVLFWSALRSHGIASAIVVRDSESASRQRGQCYRLKHDAGMWEIKARDTAYRSVRKDRMCYCTRKGIDWPGGRERSDLRSVRLPMSVNWNISSESSH